MVGRVSLSGEWLSGVMFDISFVRGRDTAFWVWDVLGTGGPIVGRWCGFLGTGYKHPARTGPQVCPQHQYSLIQTTDKPWTQTRLSMMIESSDQVKEAAWQVEGILLNWAWNVLRWAHSSAWDFRILCLDAMSFAQIIYLGILWLKSR